MLYAIGMSKSRTESRREYVARQIKLNPRYVLELNLKRLYGMTLGEYDSIRLRQGNRCAACRRYPAKEGRLSMRLAVDHDHETNRLRGLLCHSCNIALGWAEDSSDRLRMLADYIDKYNQSIGNVSKQVAS